MLHVWLLPALCLLVVVLLGFYWVIRSHGGDGVRTAGRCVCDQEAEEDRQNG